MARLIWALWTGDAESLDMFSISAMSAHGLMFQGTSRLARIQSLLRG